MGPKNLKIFKKKSEKGIGVGVGVDGADNKKLITVKSDSKQTIFTINSKCTRSIAFTIFRKTPPTMRYGPIPMHSVNHSPSITGLDDCS